MCMASVYLVFPSADVAMTCPAPRDDTYFPSITDERRPVKAVEDFLSGELSLGATNIGCRRR